MRLVWALLAVTTGIAHADSGWSEYDTPASLRPATQLVESACDLEVTLRGAIAEVEQRVRLTNPGPSALAATTELVLPDRAELVGLEVKQGSRAAQPAIAVPASFASDRVSSPAVLGADPALLHALPPRDGRPRFRLILQPLASEQDTTITTRWIRAADLRGGALHLSLPGREGKPCRGSIHAQPGPGVSIARVRVAGKESATRTFSLEAVDLALDVDLAFKRNEPVVWTQTESLGDGWLAQAITVVTPPARAIAAKRVLFVIDGSRSMELVGRHRVKQIVHTLAGVLPRGTDVDAIIYDRAATRVLGSWQPIDAKQLQAIETAIDTHAAGNGSDAKAAFTLARQSIAELRGETQIVLVTDGVMGEQSDNALGDALGQLQVQLHAIVLSNGRMRSPNADPLRLAINRTGGSYRELDVEQIDSALAVLDDWLRPSWLELELTSANVAISELRAGSGVVVMSIAKRPRKPTLTGHGTKPIKVAAQAAPAAPLGELVLAVAADEDNADLDQAQLAKLRARHPVVDDDHPFVVLAAVGKIAKNRRDMTANGGPYTRMLEVSDPAFPADPRIAQASVGGSAIDRGTLELLFRVQLQPAAFACYQKALGRLPKLAGTAQFHLEIGRGETTYAIVTGLGDAAFDACLLDAAYTVTPSLPNPAFNTDDRTVANYPLTFNVREQKPFVIAGDADSSSPLDIDKIQGGVPVHIKAGDTSTPLGNLRPSKSP
ncbi:MAG TPA: VWA domain-containing protein [Kofleriaceae bacterium]